MPYRRPALPVLVIPVLLAVAVLGYLVGHTSSHPAAALRAPSVAAGDVVLDYPAGWRVVANPPVIPSFEVARVTVLAPRGHGADTGLLIGTLPADELAPLPRAFVTKLRRTPTTEIVNLLEIQAYRYAHLSVRGFAETLTIFVVPNRGGLPTALACYAPSASSAYVTACERSVAAVTVTGQLQGAQLTPDPAYAVRISSTISALDALRISLKRELSPEVSAATAQRLASRLARGYAAASSALGELEPPVEAAPVQTALAQAINRSRTGYIALAKAASEQDATAYTAAQSDIAHAEADVDQALESFALIGYGKALPSGGTDIRESS
jgi:hypothetical protein